MANVSIITYGTFGIWGAFLGNPKYIIVSQQMINQTKEGYELNQAHLSNVIII